MRPWPPWKQSALTMSIEWRAISSARTSSGSPRWRPPSTSAASSGGSGCHEVRAMTSTVPTPALAASVPQRNASEDLRLACLHLRLGMLTAARAELEDLEHRGELGAGGRAALAEARWRSGDLEAAGEAAQAHLAAGGQDL